MKSVAKNIKIASLDDLFSTEETRQDADREKVQELSLTDLHPFQNHPFKVLDDESMAEMVDSIQQYGLLVPAIVRPRAAGGYELISGHRRHRACCLAGLSSMPAIIRDLDDDAAILVMVDSNLQREHILPSERAFAYKMKLDAMKRQAGRRSKNNCGQLGHNSEALRSREILALQTGDSARNIQRYVHLTELVPPLLSMVDNKQMALNPAYELSFLSSEEQVQLLDAMDQEQATPSLSQAQRLKKFSQEGRLTRDVMVGILSEDKKGDCGKVAFSSSSLQQYFPKEYTPQRMQETILQLLENWRKNGHKF